MHTKSNIDIPYWANLWASFILCTTYGHPPYVASKFPAKEKEKVHQIIKYLIAVVTHFTYNPLARIIHLTPHRFERVH